LPGLRFLVPLAFAVASLASGIRAAAAFECSAPEQIATDRPDVTNASPPVPVGSFQVENGVDLTGAGGTRVLQGTNTLLRLGIAECTELLLQLPSRSETVRGAGSSGFSDLAPGIKRQLLGGDFDLFGIAGVLLPTGSESIDGKGFQPFLQLPWSVELSGGWGIDGQATVTVAPSEPKSNPTTQVTFGVTREFGERADMFLEYIGEFAAHLPADHRLNAGGGYRVTPMQQIDFHVGIGLNEAAPDWFVGVGYSFRFDRLF